MAYESTNLYTKHYVYENGSFVPLIQATYRQQINQHQTPQWEHGYDYDKDPLWHTVQKANSFDRVWFYHCDHLGTPQEMSDQTGTIVWTANYKAWGECKTENHTKRDIWDSEIITNNLRFQGQYFDQETGLHYNRFRYYSPYVGRFISKDPIGLLGGLNTFAYAPNPVEWVDPLGLNKVCTCCPPVPSGKNVFYHYTDTAGMAGILTSQKLFPSLKANNPKDARYGDGQYVTDIILRSQSDKSIAKALYNQDQPRHVAKVQNWIAIDTTGLEVEKGGRNNIFVILNDQALDLHGRIVGFGRSSCP